MAIVMLPVEFSHHLAIDWPAGDLTLPFDTETLADILEALSPNDYTYIRVIGGTHYETIKVTEGLSDDLTIERAQEGTSDQNFFAGDCLVPYEVAVDDIVIPSCVEIETDTPAEIEIEGDCVDGFKVNFIGEIPDVSGFCATPTQGTLSPSSRIMLDGCEYVTLAQLCAALADC